MTARRMASIGLWVAVLGVAAWKIWPRDDGGSGPRTEPAPRAAAADGDLEEDSAPRAGAADRSGGPRRPGAPVRLRGRDGAGPASGPLAESFGAERRNAEWAAAREEEVRRRADSVLAAAVREGGQPARAGAVECRTSTCRLALSADDPRDLARAIEWLGDEDGFYRFAEDMTVVATDEGEAGPRAVDVYLRFSR